jgi:hypothetical protein
MFTEGLKDMLNWNALLRKTTINQMVMPYNTILERSILDVLLDYALKPSSMLMVPALLCG